MKRINLILGFVVILTQCIFSQMRITNSVFPKPEDTLKTIYTINVPTALQMGTTGGPKTWDFSQLKTGLKQREIYALPSAGKDAAFFPEANLLLLSDGQEFYIRSTAQIMEAIGIGGQNEFLDTNLIIKYNKRPVLRKAPLEFINTTFSQGEFRIDLNARIIPDTLLEGLPIKPDSIRFQVSNTLRGLIDAYGTIKMHGKNYEVLREKAEVISEAKVFIKVLGLWVDLFAIAGGNIPEGFGNILGKDTTISYIFYNNIKKEAIVSAEYTPDGTFLGVTFIDDGTLTSSVDLTAIDTRFKIYPNPASEYIDIEIGETSTSYTCLVSDMSGSYVHFDIILSGNAARLNTMDWPDGLYLIQLFSPSGKMSFSQKIIKN